VLEGRQAVAAPEDDLAVADHRYRAAGPVEAIPLEEELLGLLGEGWFVGGFIGLGGQSSRAGGGQDEDQEESDR
jgi:hypothetical protein